MKSARTTAPFFMAVGYSLVLAAGGVWFLAACLGMSLDSLEASHQEPKNITAVFTAHRTREPVVLARCR